MQRIFLIGIFLCTIFLAILWTSLAQAASVASYNDTCNYNNFVDTNDTEAVAQTFTASISGTLSTVDLYLRTDGIHTPSGNYVVKIYNVTGTMGSTAMPTGSALATSDAYNVSALTSTYQDITFTFSGANMINITSGGKYAASLEGSSANNVELCAHNPGSAAGNPAYLSGSWLSAADFGSTEDNVFAVNGWSVSAPTQSATSMMIGSDF